MRNKLDVTIRIDDIFCYDEGDGPGNAEPYLWACYYKLDGTTCRLGADWYLQGRCVIQRVNGQQGNLANTNVSGGDTVPVPAAIGTWQTELVPIPIDPALAQLGWDIKKWTDIPGMIGVMFVLMEQDNLPADAAAAGYATLCTTFEAALNKLLVHNLGITKNTVSDQDRQAISDAVSAAVKAAIVDSLNVISSVVQWIAGPDDILGSSSFQIGHDDLLTQKSMTFSQRWKDGVSVGGAKDLIVDGPGRFVTSGGEWELHGHIEATEIIEFIPLPTDAPMLSPVTGAPDETWNGTWHGTLPGTDTPAIVVTIESGSPGAHSVSVRESLSFHPPANTQASAVATSLAMFTSYTHDIWTFPQESVPLHHGAPINAHAEGRATHAPAPKTVPAGVARQQLIGGLRPRLAIPNTEFEQLAPDPKLALVLYEEAGTGLNYHLRYTRTGSDGQTIEDVMLSRYIALH